MKKITQFFIGILKLILGIINFILIVIIVLNVLILLSTFVAKSSYPTILDYSYHKMDINDSENHLNNGDLLIIDARKAYEINNIVMFQDNKKTAAGKIIDLDDKNVIINSNNQDLTIKKEKVIGPMLINIPKLGFIIDIILKPVTLAISVVVLIITSIIGGFLHKRTKSSKDAKPNFNQMKNI